MQNAFALTVLVFVGVAGSVPFIIGMMDPESAGPTFSAAYDVIVREPSSSVVFAVLFGVGAVMCFQITKPVFAILLIPSLFAAVWPFFRFDAAILPVPTGAIVAFAAEHPSAPNGNMGCPIGWKHHAELAGRFALGSGEGIANLDGQTPRERKLGEPLGGAESIVLLEDHLPDHRHHIMTTGEGTVPVASDNALSVWGRRKKNEYNYTLEAFVDKEPTIGETSSIGRNAPHENMPPYKVVLFCEFVGDTQDEAPVKEAPEESTQ